MITIDHQPSDLVPRLEGEQESEYRRILDFCLVPHDKRTSEHLGLRWSISQSAVKKCIKKYTIRANPWDMYMQGKTTQATLEAYASEGVSLAQQHTQMWGKVKEIGMKAMDKILNDPNGLDLISPKDALAFVDAAFKADRLLAGESTENLAVNHAMVMDTSTLTLEEKKQLRLLLLKTTTTATSPVKQDAEGEELS